MKIQKIDIDDFQSVYWLRDYGRRGSAYRYVGSVGQQYDEYYKPEYGCWKEHIGLFSSSMGISINIGFVI